jgi:hypothetical protein
MNECDVRRYSMKLIDLDVSDANSIRFGAYQVLCDAPANLTYIGGLEADFGVSSGLESIKKGILYGNACTWEFTKIFWTSICGKADTRRV